RSFATSSARSRYVAAVHVSGRPSGAAVCAPRALPWPHAASRWLGANTRYPADANASIRNRDCVAQAWRPCEKMITGWVSGESGLRDHIVTDMPAILSWYSDSTANPAIATAIVNDRVNTKVRALMRTSRRQFCNADRSRGG